jgi:hypothetical protein
MTVALKETKEMKSPFRSMLLAGVLVASMPVLSLADAPAGAGERPADAGRRHRGGHRFALSELVSRHAQELGVSADVITKMKAAEDAAKPELDQLHLAVRAAREKVAAGGDRAPLETAHQALRARRQALRTQLTAMLTEQQRTKLQELAGKHGGRSRRGHADKPAQTL